MSIKQKYLITILVFFVLIFIATFAGRYQSASGVLDYKSDPLFKRLVFDIRIPRIILSIIVGAGLAASGLIMQTIFQNSLADPGILGINQAAGFGAALGYILFPTSNLPIRVIAFVSGIFALFLIILISRQINVYRRLSLIFAGIAVSAFFSAGLGLIKYLADPLNQLPSVVFWLLGSLSTTNWQAVAEITPISVACIITLFLLRWRTNAYALNDSILHSMGIKRNLEIYAVLSISVLLTTVIISYTGLIGWVGLIIPNIARLIFGYDLRRSLPSAIIIGAIFVLISDTMARTLVAGEIPLGIITAFFGALIFVILMFAKGNSLQKNG